MRKRKSGQPAGTDLDWFVIPIQKIRQWAIVLVASSGRRRRRVLRLPAQPTARRRTGRRPRSPRPRRCWPGRRGPSGATRPGSNVAQARDFLRDARESFSAVPLRRGVPSRRRVPVLLAPRARRLGRGGAGRRVLHLRRGRRLAPARGPLDLRAGAPARAALRRRLRQGRQDGLGRDHVLRRDALHDPPGIALRVPPAGFVGSQRAARSRSSRAPSTSTRRASTSTVATDTATAAIDRDSRVSVDVAPGDKTEVTSFRGRTTVSTGKESVVLEGREKVSAAARSRARSRPRSPCPTRRSRPCRPTTGSTT